MHSQENKKKKFVDFFKNLDHFSYGFEAFFGKHKKKIGISFLTLVILFASYFFYQESYVAPREKRALDLFSEAKDHFLKNYESPENLEKTLGGNPKEGYIGFIDVLKKYASTKAANLSNFYVGLTYYKLKRYEEAIKHLKAFSSKDDILPSVKLGLIGDSLVELGKEEEALSNYLSAAKQKDNEFNQVFYYQKAGLLAFSMKNYEKAKQYLGFIKEKYPETKTSVDLDKYLAIAKYKLSK